MIAKALGALALALIPLAHATPETISYSSNESIVQVVCKLEGGTGRGSAVRVSPQYLLSVAHVTELGTCTIKGRPIEVVYEDRDSDFSVIRLDGDEPAMKVDCSGYHWGEPVYAIGFARGLPDRRILALAATGQYVTLAGRHTPFSLLAHNRVIPGMSGGAIVSNEGALVGMVNAYSMFLNISFSRELKDTPVCR